MSLCQHLCCDMLCDLLAAGSAHLCQRCFCYITMQKAPHIRSAHQRQSGNQHGPYAQAHAVYFVQGCSVRKGKSKQDDPPPFLTAQLGRYED